MLRLAIGIFIVLGADFLAQLKADFQMITLLRSNQYTDLTSFTDVGEFVPLRRDKQGQVVCEVAPARFSLSCTEAAGEQLPLYVALIRDWRRTVPVVLKEQEVEEPWSLSDDGCQMTIRNREDVIDMVQETIRKLGGLNILVNNAGIQVTANSDELTMEQVDRVLNVNLRGAFMCAREAIKHFLAEEKPGLIINVSSVHQIIPKPRFVGYAMSKGGMQNLTRTLALEYAGRNIRVNAIGPGATITPINRAWVDDPQKAEMVLQHIPMSRAGATEEMAAVTAFLASDEAAYITGQTLYVDGGLTLYPDFRTAWSSE